MEIEYFVEDNDESAAVHYKQWQEESMKFWLETLQLTEANLRFREHEVDELSHYSKGTFDVEFNYPW
jgi:glycyl-tRNA synthetase